jgi:hypothetical protein
MGDLSFSEALRKKLKHALYDADLISSLIATVFIKPYSNRISVVLRIPETKFAQFTNDFF